ncbi:recombinase family protein [Enterococcus faecium]|uniref:recombinase family protein n=1 Tax=Enterococcus faecium TaxID=1352 RepID=UPI0021ADD579|nr:recombinase family protein [Enterococcus faecium]UWS52303.1 recombinase family protein [Enterococcus faecium]
MKRVALYMRVSTEQQAKHGDSLREQKETLYEYIEQHKDLKVVNEYVDGGISGQKINRDEFQKLLQDVKENKIDLILFTKLDRWFRNLRHYLNTQEILEKHNVSWNAVSQQYYDTTTAYGRTFIAQVMSFAELEAQIDSERIKAVMANKIAQGEVVSGKTPLGYSIENKKLVINDDAPIVIDIFNYFLSSGSLRKTVYYLGSQYGIVRDYQSVKNMLTNKKYIGELRNNKNYCPPIIDKKLFYAVQKALPKNLKTNAKRDYIFKGLLKCSDCQGSVAGQTIKARYKKKDGTESIYERTCYRCVKRRNNKLRCTNKRAFYEKNLERYIFEATKQKFEQIQINYSKKQPKIIKKKNSKKNIENKLDRLKKAYLNEVIDLEEYKKDREALMKELNEIEVEPAKIDIKNVEFILSKEFDEIYKESSEEEKNALWRPSDR